MAKHTPGPWEWDRQANVHGRVDPLLIFAPDGMSVALVTDRGGGAPANARLIAAAPDLLDALKLCAGVVAGETMNKNGLVLALEAACAAIRKAESDHA